VQADLLVLGHEHRGLWGRMLHSSVAERAYRLATCGVLIVPNAGAERADRATERQGVTTEVVAEPARWPAVLKEFTNRNAARRVNIEVFTPDIGAQAASVNFPLYGVDYDGEDRAVEVMLGDLERKERHLTHSVRGVRSIEISRHPDGAPTGRCDSSTRAGRRC
jgi:hypothetical protein